MTATGEHFRARRVVLAPDLSQPAPSSVTAMVWPARRQASGENSDAPRTDLIPLPAGSSATSLQDLVDELADLLGRSVIMQDPDFRLVAASVQGDDIDDLQVRTLLARAMPQQEREWADHEGVSRTRHPVAVDFAQSGAHERLIIPVWVGEEQLGTIWLIKTGLPALREEQFRAIDAAVAVAGALLHAHARGTVRSAREAVFRALLAGHPSTRREALASAIRSHGVMRGPETVVRAVLLGQEAAVIQRAAFGQTLEVAARHAMIFIGELETALLFVERRNARQNIDDLIAAEAERAGVRLIAIGSAALSGVETDLLPIARRAVATASVVATMPDLGSSAQSEEVGPWLLLADVLADPERLEWYSPAAYALIHDPEPMRRETVEVLLDSANQIRAVCDSLHIHRTTLYYRLENMPPVVRDALSDGLQRSALHLALKLARYWENAGHLASPKLQWGATSDGPE